MRGQADCIAVATPSSMSQLKESRFDVLSFVAAGEELPVKLEKEKPVPPPLLCMRAAFLRVSKMLSMESSIGRTKQAAN